MKIALVTSGSGMFDIHMSHDMTYLVRYLAGRGHVVTVIDAAYTRETVGTEEVGNVTLVRLPAWRLRLTPRLWPDWATFFPSLVSLLLNRLSYARSVGRYLAQEKQDIIHCQSAAVLLVLFPVLPSLRHRTILHSMVAARAGLRTSWLDWLVLAVENRVARRVKQVVVETELARDRLLTQAGVEPDKVCIVNVGVDCEYYRPSLTQRVDIREQFGLENRVLVLFLARIIERKGVEYLIKAAHILVNERSHKDVVFVVAGPTTGGVDAPGSVTPYVKRLTSLVESNGLDDHVRFVLGWCPARDYLARADIYVLPTLADLTPYSILEAMAMGKPVVSTTIGGIPTLIQDGENGFLIPPRCEGALADRLEALIADPELRKRMGEESRRRVQQYSLEKRAQRFEELYLNLVDG